MKNARRVIWRVFFILVGSSRREEVAGGCCAARAAQQKGRGPSDSLGCILPTPNAPGQRVFSRCAAPFSLKYVSIPAEKCLAQRKNSSLPVTLGVFRYTLELLGQNNAKIFHFRRRGRCPHRPAQKADPKRGNLRQKRTAKGRTESSAPTEAVRPQKGRCGHRPLRSCARHPKLPPPQPPHKDFCRAKVPCDGQRPKVCRSAARSL